MIVGRDPKRFSHFLSIYRKENIKERKDFLPKYWSGEKQSRIDLSWRESPTLDEGELIWQCQKIPNVYMMFNLHR